MYIDQIIIEKESIEIFYNDEITTKEDNLQRINLFQICLDNQTTEYSYYIITNIIKEYREKKPLKTALLNSQHKEYGLHGIIKEISKLALTNKLEDMLIDC